MTVALATPSFVAIRRVPNPSVLSFFAFATTNLYNSGRTIGFPDLAAMPAGEYEGDYGPPAAMPRKALEKETMSQEDIDLMINKKEAMLKHMRKVPVLAEEISEQNKEIEELKKSA